jgi:thiol-disulfide isomerase/thioredoxin
VHRSASRRASISAGKRVSGHRARVTAHGRSCARSSSLTPCDFQRASKIVARAMSTALQSGSPSPYLEATETRIPPRACIVFLDPYKKMATSPFKQAYMPYALFLLGVVLIFVWAIYGRHGRREGFENGGAGSTYVTAVPYKFHMYYADWCPHCHAAKPEFEKLTGGGASTLTIGGKQVLIEAIEAEKNPEKVLTKVSGYPTVRLYDAQGNLVKEYEGERTEAGFRSFLEDVLNRPSA